MTARDDLERLLTTDPRDVGCDETFEHVHAYAELVIAGVDPERDYPGITVQLASCGPCAEDFHGLLALLRAEADEISPGWKRDPGH